jgi:hypothetical protein
MLRAKNRRGDRNRRDDSADFRPKLNMRGIGKVMGLSRATVYRRLERETFSLEGIPMLVTSYGTFYDMEGVFKKVFPSADSNTISELMYDFMQRNKSTVK